MYEFLLAFHSNYGAISYRLRDIASYRSSLGLDRRSHITTALQKLHWLLDKYRVTFKLLLSCIRLSTVDARRTSLTLSCLLRLTRMYANFAPPLLGPLPSNEAGRSSEGVPSQWPAPTYGTVSPPPSVPSTPTQPSVVRSRHIILFRLAFDY